jgi:hypothetical protein
MSFLDRALRASWRLVEHRLNLHGYAIEWVPREMLSGSNRLECTFEFAAAHLMLRKNPIFFISIGANDGVSNDPIWPFASRFGWEGLAVEPNPQWR